MFYCNIRINEVTGETCNTILRSDGADSRQEWCDEFYVCPKCGAEYTLHTIFKTQSHIIESQELTDGNGKVVS